MARYFEELLYLVVLGIALMFLIKGTLALAKITVASVPAPAGLKSFVAS